MATQDAGAKNGWKQWKPEQARQALESWRASGLSLAAYARRRGVTTQRLHWWRTRLGEWNDTVVVKDEARLVPAHVTSAMMSSAAAVTVRLANDVTLEVTDVGAVPPEWVATLAKLARAG